LGQQEDFSKKLLDSYSHEKARQNALKSHGFPWIFTGRINRGGDKMAGAVGRMG
jgi:glutaredoxin